MFKRSWKALAVSSKNPVAEYKNVTDHKNDHHEYHEISDEDVNLHSPTENLDFGPSFMDEVFKELDIKPEHDHDSTANGNNIKNEIKEIASKLTLGKDKKKHATVKPISASDSQNLDSAIALAKELASRSIMDLDFRNDNMAFECPSSADSPRTPNSPNKKTNKFTFKFKSSPKNERRTFREEAEKILGHFSIISDEAKEAYNSLIERKKSTSSDKQDVLSPETRLSSSSNHHSRQVSLESTDLESEPGEANPLRMLRNGVNVIPKVRGNKQRVASTPQTASLARLTSGPARSNLGTPPPPPTTSSNNNHDPNPIPLPPRDRHNPTVMAPLKHHQRKHPLLIPQVPSNGSHDSSGDGDHPILPTFRPHGPVLKQVVCPEPPKSYLHSLTIDPDISSLKHVPGPPKPVRTFAEDLSFESEIKAAIHNLDSFKTTVNNGTNGKDSSKSESVVDFATKKVQLTQSPKPAVKGADSDEVRVIQKVLANEVQLSVEECVELLQRTDWDVHNAIKCVRLREKLKSHSIPWDSKWIDTLEKSKWNVRQASNYLIATQGTLDDTTEV